MSVYSGFATRNQQKHYDNVIYNLISTLMVRIVKFYKSQIVNQSAFKKILKQQFKILNKLQKHKYLDPKYADLLSHFIKVLLKQQKNQQHHQFEMRRKSIEEYQAQQKTFNRTLSVLGKQINQLKNYTDKIDTIQFHQLTENSEKGLEKIPQKLSKHKKHKSKKKSISRQQNSIKSQIDLWQLRKEKLPMIPSLQPIQQKILQKTTNRFRSKNQQVNLIDFSQKNTQRSLDDQSVIQASNNGKMLNKAPKFRSKMFFRE